MRQTVLCAFSIALLALSSGCSKSDQEKAREKAAEARQKTKQGAQKLAQEVKQDAGALDRKISQAVHGQAVQSNGTGEAEEKLRRGGEDLRVAGSRAAVKLDRAAIVAKVKTKLASDVGLSTVTSVDVDSTGQVVTLSGTVSSPEQKQQAEHAALAVNGVTKVINNLRVQP